MAFDVQIAQASKLAASSSSAPPRPSSCRSSLALDSLNPKSWLRSFASSRRILSASSLSRARPRSSSLEERATTMRESGFRWGTVRCRGQLSSSCTGQVLIDILRQCGVQVHVRVLRQRDHREHQAARWHGLLALLRASCVTLPRATEFADSVSLRKSSSPVASARVPTSGAACKQPLNPRFPSQLTASLRARSLLPGKSRTHSHLSLQAEGGIRRHNPLAPFAGTRSEGGEGYLRRTDLLALRS